MLTSGTAMLPAIATLPGRILLNSNPTPFAADGLTDGPDTVTVSEDANSSITVFLKDVRAIFLPPSLNRPEEGLLDVANWMLAAGAISVIRDGLSAKINAGGANGVRGFIFVDESAAVAVLRREFSTAAEQVNLRLQCDYC